MHEEEVMNTYWKQTEQRKVFTLKKNDMALIVKSALIEKF